MASIAGPAEAQRGVGGGEARVIPLVLEDAPGRAYLLASPYHEAVPSDPPALVVLDP